MASGGGGGCLGFGTGGGLGGGRGAGGALAGDGGGGGVVSASALGTGGELGRHPEGFSRLGVLGDTWHSPKVSPKEFPKGLSAGLRDAWRAPKGSEGGLSGWQWSLD